MLSPADVVVLCVLASTFACARAFYLSANVLGFQQAQQFCQQQCSSELASIHSQAAYNEILSSIQRLTPADPDAASLWGDISRVWLGLYQYAWSDGTPLDYGDTLDSTGSYPWASDQPTALSECVQINAVNEKWYDSPCTEHAHAACNHCDGVLNHFALVTTHKMTRVEAEVACAQQYNSTLASIHNERHAQELRVLWNVTRAPGAAAATAAWIGLEIDNHTSSAFVWDDDTPVDYGSSNSSSSSSHDVGGDDPDESECAPWNATQPDNAGGDEYCVWLDEASGCWSDTDCNASLAYPICALTSEFSTTLNEWHLDAKVVATAENYLIAKLGVDSEAFLEDTWWHNGDAPMLIEWTFTVAIDGIQGPWTGLTIYNDPTGSNCHWYWLGVEVYSGVFTFYIERGKPEFQDRTIYETGLPFTIEAGQDVTMLASITTNKETPTQPVFNVWINGEQVVLDWADVGGFHVLQSGHSGYIGLENGASARCVNKALFVSGAPMEAPEFDDYWCNEANSVPTVDPTAAPTNTATADDDAHAAGSSSMLTYILIGGGVVVLVAAIAGGVVCWRRRRVPAKAEGVDASEADENAEAKNGVVPVPGVSPRSLPSSGFAGDNNHNNNGAMVQMAAMHMQAQMMAQANYTPYGTQGFTPYNAFTPFNATPNYVAVAQLQEAPMLPPEAGRKVDEGDDDGEKKEVPKGEESVEEGTVATTGAHITNSRHGTSVFTDGQGGVGPGAAMSFERRDSGTENTEELFDVFSDDDDDDAGANARDTPGIGAAADIGAEEDEKANVDMIRQAPRGRQSESELPDVPAIPEMPMSMDETIEELAEDDEDEELTGAPGF